MRNSILKVHNLIVLVIVLSIFAIISFGCGGGGDDENDSADVLQPTKMIYSEISGDSDLIAMTTNDEGDIVGVLSNNNRQSVTGAFYILPDESQERKYMMLEFGEDGLPASISFPDGSIYTLSNYTENSVDILLKNPDGSEVGPETVDDVSASDLNRLRDLITAGATTSSELTADVWNAVGLNLSIGGCAITSANALGSGDTAVSIASASCGSNIISTIDSATESKILNNTGETLNAVSCASTPTDSASILSCLTHLTDEVALNQNKWPIVVSTSPADGETDVSSNLNTISINFSKKMAGLPWYGFSISCDGLNCSDSVWPNSSLKWSADGKTFSITRGNAGTPLPSGVTLSIALNPTDYTPAFRDINGNPLPPYYFSFKVGE